MKETTPTPATFPAGGLITGDLECDRCDCPASRGYEGAGADGFLNFCESCFYDFEEFLAEEVETA